MMYLKVLFFESLILLIVWSNLAKGRSFGGLSSILEEDTSFIGYRRVQRSVAGESSPFGRKQDMHCSLACIEKFMDALRKTTYSEEPVLIAAGEDNYMKEYNEKSVDETCKAYIPISSCMKNCPNEDRLKKSFLDRHSNLEVMCITDNKAFKKEMPCISVEYEKAKRLGQNQCDSKCGKYPNSFKQGNELQQRETIIREIKATFNDSCSRIKCNLSCEKPSLFTKCGQGAALLKEKIVIGRFRTINSLAETMALNLHLNEKELQMPACKKVD